MKKRIMTSEQKQNALMYVKDKVDYGDNLQIIYVSDDSNIIIYENFSDESITICSKDIKYIKEIFVRDLYNKWFLPYLMGYLEEYYNTDYVKKILDDFSNTDLENYEIIKQPYKTIF